MAYLFCFAQKILDDHKYIIMIVCASLCTCESFESIPRPSAKWLTDNVIRKQKSLHFNTATFISAKYADQNLGQFEIS